MVRLVLLSLVGSSCLQAAAAFQANPGAVSTLSSAAHRALAKRSSAVTSGWALRGGAARGITMSAGLSDAMKAGEKAVVAAAVATRHVAASLSLNMEEGTLGKKDFSPVTVGDFAVQAIVCKRIGEVFPEDGIIAEESADELRKPEMADLLGKVVDAVRTVEPSATPDQVCEWIDRGTLREHRPRYWTLDPIDGTKGFLRRQQYSICLGLILDGKPAAGAMACPNLQLDFHAADPPADQVGILFSAYEGGGAWSTPMPPDPSGQAGSAGGGQRHTLQLAAGAPLRFCEGVEPGHSDQASSPAPPPPAPPLPLPLTPRCSDQATNAKIAAELGITAAPVRLDSQVKYGVMARGDAEVYLRLPLKAKTKVPCPPARPPAAPCLPQCVLAASALALRARRGRTRCRGTGSTLRTSGTTRSARSSCRRRAASSRT
jgi:3'(2'), 5'-bisphosphate nucleotidase